MIIAREKIRVAIREMPTISNLRQLVNDCFNFKTQKEDKEFITECLSEIYYREKENDKT